jgi:hypothetical protein
MRNNPAAQMRNNPAENWPRYPSSQRQLPDSTRPPRRFSPPWPSKKATESFSIRDANGQALAFVYCGGETRREMRKLMLVPLI